jgi:hypothetical protein
VVDQNIRLFQGGRDGGGIGREDCLMGGREVNFPVVEGPDELPEFGRRRPVVRGVKDLFPLDNGLLLGPSMDLFSEATDSVKEIGSGELRTEMPPLLSKHLDLRGEGGVESADVACRDM